MAPAGEQPCARFDAPVDGGQPDRQLEAMERSFQAQVLIPTAISVAFGLVFATFSTLVAIPCLINIGNDIRRFYHLLLYGTYVSPVAVEPRSNRYHLKEKRGSL